MLEPGLADLTVPRQDVNMSNTGRNKKLASFNCDVELWEQFTRQCRDNSTTATAVLINFISQYVNNPLSEVVKSSGNIKDPGKIDWEQLIKQQVDKYLEQNLPSYLDKYIASNQETGKKRQLNTQNKEYWLVKERAKYLGKEITDNQLIHIELYANDAFKQRHGTLPKKKLFRNIESFTYPKSDVDILDAAILKITGD
ncbi:hypothetical protein [Nostoc favosum]|uniref:Uncharacterized protein n=1 Tax=Nostoc favosum CHAB5714 TaxID=2780399 RepID=A0ABS8IMB1_9NOSO|nr:hypothetical protein [Nostoc favosum]MCC5605141.1 hypothetical protein [Nostoc favosum CHAB5714]